MKWPGVLCGVEWRGVGCGVGCGVDCCGVVVCGVVKVLRCVVWSGMVRGE